MKTLKDIFNEVYRPKAKDEQDFVDKHVIEKKPDRNEVSGKVNGDDVFQASNIKMGSRSKTRHGYDPGQDEDVYDSGRDENTQKKVAEETEDLDEKHLSSGEMSKREKLVKKMKGSDWEKRYPGRGKEVMYATATKLAKEDIINRAIEKYMPDIADYTPPTMEERLVSKMEGFTESHIHTLLDLFNNLSEDNQYRMIDKADTREGIIELINFAIETRGE